MKARYFNPFTDFGFKKLFGEEASKPLLKDFLNALLLLDYPIAELNFRNAEQLGTESEDRRAVYDIYCQDTQGNYFIVEMQKAYQKFFKDRALYYTTFPIQEQAQKGHWSFELKSVFCVGILDFVFEEDKDNPDFLHEVKLKNRHNSVFYDKYALYFIEMPKFHKAESELANQLENWIYFLKHLEDFPEIPARFQDSILEQAFEIAELAHLSEHERAAYEHSLKIYRDNMNTLNSATERAWASGKQEGLIEGKRITAIEMKTDGIPLDKIMQYTGLSQDEIDNL
jgi:predicted transposase/invertase (TIGR01784 family)